MEFVFLYGQPCCRSAVDQVETFDTADFAHFAKFVAAQIDALCKNVKVIHDYISVLINYQLRLTLVELTTRRLFFPLCESVLLIQTYIVVKLGALGSQSSVSYNQCQQMLQELTNYYLSVKTKRTKIGHKKHRKPADGKNRETCALDQIKEERLYTPWDFGVS